MRPVSRWPAVALVAVLALAALLRCTGLSWGLRHAPEWDEALFVRSVAEMLRNQDLEQRFYLYPGLFLHLLRAALMWLSPESLDSGRAYLVARGVVVAFSVLSVGLAYRLGSALVSPRAGVVAAFLLAISPVEITTAHMVRPDVVLEAFALMALLSLRLGRPEPRSDAFAGAVLGASAAVKLTGVALWPSLAVDRWLSPGRRVQGLVVAGLAAVALFVAATPDLLSHPAEFVAGFRLQWGYHRPGVPAGSLSESSLPFYLRTLWGGLGPAACLFAAVGLWETRQRPRTWAPIAVFPLALLAILLSSHVHWSRLILPCFGALSVIAGRGFETVAQRLPRVAWAVLLAGSLTPVVTTAWYLQRVSRPGTRDRALDWIAAHIPQGGSVLTSVEGLGLDRSRFEVFRTTGVPAADRRMAGIVDAVVLNSRETDLLPPLPPALALASDSTVSGPALLLFAGPESVRRLRRPVPLERTSLTASSAESDLFLAVDGRLDTYWKTPERNTDDAWVEIALDREVRLSGIDLLLGGRPGRAGRHLTTWVPGGGREEWRSVPTAVYRSESSAGEADRQVVLFEPTLVRKVRVHADSPPLQRWGFAEIRLYENADPS